MLRRIELRLDAAESHAGPKALETIRLMRRAIDDSRTNYKLAVPADPGALVITGPTTGNNYVQYTTAMTSSGSPDVIITYVYNPVISWAANGFIQPLDQYAAEAGIKQEDFFPVAWQMIRLRGLLTDPAAQRDQVEVRLARPPSAWHRLRMALAWIGGKRARSKPSELGL